MNCAVFRFVPLALALGLAGCGVKGPLEPPPESGVKPNATAPQPATTPVIPGTLAGPDAPTYSPSVGAVARGTTSESVVNAPAAERSSPLDWLID
ncbi:MAG: lipoprotein [Variibacter sp.]|nr:lipoprotein [Variibacter sp.]